MAELISKKIQGGRKEWCRTRPSGKTTARPAWQRGKEPRNARRIALSILHDDPGIARTVPKKKRRDALLNVACRERLLSLA